MFGYVCPRSNLVKVTDYTPSSQCNCNLHDSLHAGHGNSGGGCEAQQHSTGVRREHLQADGNFPHHPHELSGFAKCQKHDLNV